jgi:hypothetical protein
MNQSFIKTAKITVAVVVILIAGMVLGYAYYKSSHSYLTKSITELVKEACENNSDYDNIIKAHTIKEVDYNYFVEAFWYQKPPLSNDLGIIQMVKKTKVEMEAIIAGKDECTFIQFKPTTKKDVTDLKFTDFVKISQYKPENSCHAISLFKGILINNSHRIDNKTVFTFTKGLKIIETSTKDREIRTIVLFTVEFNDGNVGFYDIADDPTHKYF